MNLLSVGAAFGFATLVFQHDIGAGLLDVAHQSLVDAWALLFFFVLFGLSMDYQLFLLAATPHVTKQAGTLSAIDTMKHYEANTPGPSA